MPSGRSASHRSQIVVAPASTWYSHDGRRPLEQHVVGDVEVTGGGERREQDRRAEEAGGEVVAGLVDERGERIAELGAGLVVGREVEGDGQRARRSGSSRPPSP